MTQMNCMVLGTHSGIQTCPKPSLFDDFGGIPSFPRKLQLVPYGLPVYLPIVLCGSLGSLFPLGGNLRVSEKAPLVANRKDVAIVLIAEPRNITYCQGRTLFCLVY